MWSLRWMVHREAQGFKQDEQAPWSFKKSAGLLKVNSSANHSGNISFAVMIGLAVTLLISC